MHIQIAASNNQEFGSRWMSVERKPISAVRIINEC